MRLTSGSLFSGIGGFDLGMERAGLEIIWQCDNNPFCQKVLKKHWPNVRIYNDVKEINRSNTTSPDVIVGGFPCQPFSEAGKRKGKADDRYLWPEMLRVIRELKPRWVIGENVAGFINMELNSAFADLETEGYHVEPFVLPACAVDLPHRRNRVWIIAYPQYIRCNGSGGQLGESKEKGRLLEPKRFSRGQTRPELCRMADGLPYGVDRLRGLGNAVVPQIVQHLAELIIQVEMELIQ